jgi:hypothetical protein
VTSILGPFDVVRPLVPEEENNEWDDMYTADYEIPEHLRVSEDVLEYGRKKMRSLDRHAIALHNVAPAVTGQDEAELDEDELKVLESRKEKLTEVLAFAHSRCEYAFPQRRKGGLDS